MLVELKPGPLSFSFASGGTVKRYERGRSYPVTDELGAVLLDTGRFQPARTPTVDPKAVAQKARAEGIINALAGMGDDAMARFEALLGVALVKPAEPAEVVAPPVVTDTADDSEVEAPADGPDESGMDLLPGESRTPDSWPALVALAKDHGVKTVGRKKDQILADLANKGIK